MPEVQQLLLVGSCNSWRPDVASQSHCFSHRALSETVWQHECRLQLDKTGRLEFQVIDKTAGWGWRLFPESKDSRKLVPGDPHGVRASLSLFEEDADGQNFQLAEAAGATVLIKVQLSTSELLVWYERAEAEPQQQKSQQQFEDLRRQLQDSPTAQWVTVVWPYVPMRDQPHVGGKLVAVVKHGAQLEFEDLEPGRPVTLDDLMQHTYLKIWTLGQDGSRQKTGWASVKSEHGLHFAPVSGSTQEENALKPLLNADVQEQQRQFEMTFHTQRLWKLNKMPRAERPADDLPPGTADLVMLRKHRLYAPVNGPFSRITLCGLPGGCAGAVADWLQSVFSLQEVVVRTCAWFSGKAQGDRVRAATSDGGLLLLLLEEPLAWALAAFPGVGAHGQQGFWATRLQWREGGELGELEYAPEPEAGGDATPGVRCSAELRAPLLHEGCVHEEGTASVWSCSVHGAVAAAAQAGAAGFAILRVEDLLFRTADVAAALGDLVEARREVAEDGGGPAPALLFQGQLLQVLRGHARASLLSSEDVAQVEAATAAVRNAVGYGHAEERGRWPLLARDEVGWLQEAEYRAFDPEAKEDGRQALEFLAESGYVVFRGVASGQELEKAEALLWDFLAHCGGGIKRGIPASWALPSFSRRASEAAGDQGNATWPAEDGTGIIAGNAVGQSAFMWYLRGLPRLRKAFGLVFGTDDLISSFDGAGVFRPYGHDASWRSKSTWYHVDQGDGKRGFHSVQGLVSLTRASAETGGLVVVPGSHICHEELLRRPESRGQGRLHFEEGDPALREWSKDSAGAVLVPLEPGDAVLWDSRTIHCSTHALREAPQEVLCGNALLRAVGYVSMSPTAWATRKTLERRLDVFQDSRRPLRNITTTHNAHDMHIVKEGPLGDTPVAELSCEQLELAVGRDGGLLSTSSFEPGQPSFLPARAYRCVPEGAPVHSAPSTRWGDCIRGLTGGSSFRAHRFGQWLRLDDSEWVQACHAEPDASGPRAAAEPPPSDDDGEDLFEAAIAAAFG